MKILLTVSALVISIGGALSFYYASQSYYADSLIMDSEGGVALFGYDPVSYFSPTGPEVGEITYEAEWAGSVWHFQTKENRDQFADNPTAFAPQYGGYDALGVSKGYTNPTDPLIWDVADGKLYLFYSEKTREVWRESQLATIKQANINWPTIAARLKYADQ